MSDRVAENLPLTGSLEDYLETIYTLASDRGYARVRDIAHARDVRPASVTPAMRRLAEMGFINYSQREYIELTPTGEQAARRILSRHQLLTRFFEAILGMEGELAGRDACAMEHSLSAEAMDHLARFFEFLTTCPEGRRFMARFRGCSLVQPEQDRCLASCGATAADKKSAQRNLVPLSALAPGSVARVAQVSGGGPTRERLLDMGILPQAELRLVRRSDGGSPLWIALHGVEMALAVREAEAVLVSEKTVDAEEPSGTGARPAGRGRSLDP